MDVDVSSLNGKTKYYFCTTCENLFEVINDSGNKPECCGKTMKQLIPNTSDGAAEKHVPCLECKDNKLVVKIGSEPHPMEEAHHIEWISVQTDKGVYRRYLKPGCEPSACFQLEKDECPIAVFEYCNLHGLWMATFDTKDGKNCFDSKEGRSSRNE